MNQDIAEGKLSQLKGKLREKWGKLTDDDLKVIEGKREQLAGKLQERYGMAREDAERHARDFWKSSAAQPEKSSVAQPD